jgi:hypothetical protein
MRSTRRSRCRSLGLLAAGLAVAVSVPLWTTPVAAAEVRTETDLGGFFGEAEAAPLRVLVDDPSVPIPRPAGSAIVEADPSYTYATFNTGPTSRAVASELWPGNLLGTGLGALTEGQVSEYPLSAQASYPGGSPTANKDHGAFLMDSRAEGLDVVAKASARSVPDQVLVSFGNVASTSTVTTVKDEKSPDAVKDVSVARAVASASDISLLAGLITIDSVVTRLESRSDAVKGTSTGTTTVSGLSINGEGYTVDHNGIRSSRTPGQSLPVVPQQGTDALKTLGITVEPVSTTPSDLGVQGSRVAKGLRITLDTVLVRSVLSSSPELNDALAEAFSGIPDVPNAPMQPRGLAFYALSATPKITFVFGGANVASSASLPLSIDFPEFPVDGPLGFLPGTQGTPGTPGTPGTTPPLVPGSGGTPPTVAGPAPELPASLASATVPDPFGGLGAAALLAGLFVAGLGARGLLGVQAAALGGAALGGPSCALGAPDDVPDLRAGGAVTPGQEALR